MKKVFLFLSVFALTSIGAFSQGYATYQPMESPSIKLPSTSNSQITTQQSDIEYAKITGYYITSTINGKKVTESVILDLQIVTKQRMSNMYVIAYKPRGNDKIKLSRPAYVSNVNPYSGVDFTYYADLSIGTVYFDY